MRNRGKLRRGGGGGGRGGGDRSPLSPLKRGTFSINKLLSASYLAFFLPSSPDTHVVQRTLPPTLSLSHTPLCVLRRRKLPSSRPEGLSLSLSLRQRRHKLDLCAPISFSTSAFPNPANATASLVVLRDLTAFSQHAAATRRDGWVG